MLDLPALYLITKLAAVVVSNLIMNKAKTDVVEAIISVLSFACVFVLELLIERLMNKKPLLLILMSGTVIACFILGIEFMIPLFMVMVLHLLEHTVARDMYYQVGALVTILIFILNYSRQ